MEKKSFILKLGLQGLKLDEGQVSLKENSPKIVRSHWILCYYYLLRSIAKLSGANILCKFLGFSKIIIFWVCGPF